VRGRWEGMAQEVVFRPLWRECVCVLSCFDGVTTFREMCDTERRFLLRRLYI